MHRIRHPDAGGATAPVVAALALSPLDAAPSDDPVDIAVGPGWFDSSWDLRRGLEVSEGLPGDAGLFEWLDVFLRHRADAADPSAGRAARHLP